MIKVNGVDLFRDGVKLGWVLNGYLFNHEAKKIAYISGNLIYDHSTGKKIAYIEGEYVYYVGTVKKIRIEDEIAGIEAGQFTNATRVAIKIFFGN